MYLELATVETDAFEILCPQTAVGPIWEIPKALPPQPLVCIWNAPAGSYIWGESPKVPLCSLRVYLELGTVESNALRFCGRGQPSDPIWENSPFAAVGVYLDFAIVETMLL